MWWGGYAIGAAAPASSFFSSSALLKYSSTLARKIALRDSTLSSATRKRAHNAHDGYSMIEATERARWRRLKRARERHAAIAGKGKLEESSLLLRTANDVDEALDGGHVLGQRLLVALLVVQLDGLIHHSQRLIQHRHGCGTSGRTGLAFGTLPAPLPARENAPARDPF
jgi:hypothetical protein